MYGILLVKESGKIITNFGKKAAEAHAKRSPEKYELLTSESDKLQELKDLTNGREFYVSKENAPTIFESNPLNNYYDAREDLECDFYEVTIGEEKVYLLEKHKAIFEASELYEVKECETPIVEEPVKEEETVKLETPKKKRKKKVVVKEEQSNDANAPLEDKNLEEQK